MTNRVAIVGAGAVGGYIGAYLARAGHDVTLIDPWPENVEAVRRDGFSLSGLTPEESINVPVRILHVGDVQGFVREAPFDIALIALKSYDTLWATRLILPYLTPQGVIASAQNCINDERVASVAGRERTVGVVIAGIAAELYEPAKIRRAVPRGVPGVLRVGELDGSLTPRLQNLAAVLGDVDTVQITTDLYAERWTKLSVNAMRNSLSAASSLSGNDITRNDVARRFAIRLGSEAVDVGFAQGLKLQAVSRIDPDTLRRAGRGDAAAYTEVEGILIEETRNGRRSEYQRPSMGQDVLRGRRTEIDFLNALVVETGSRLGIATPANAAIVAAVRGIERGELSPSAELIATLEQEILAAT
ncbi:2-dehydropantoate 2-reductase [Angulomicrobium tetraedrale]|uniref:2-dehydropantoate 2-reductase n=1 Tax=Ancylobacter tetraedralis TaxID=217068 RepID=A0A839Z7A9_9HYPH|nr:2-dehydropantoate 2-reductase [Ancylobacter tetraedralis]MBB3770038.1 2-dehydropantoate 2-reductase [Ancylobacter tetraedralis]